MNAIEMKVDGVPVFLDVSADLAMGDLTEDMDAIASQIGWYGRCLAAARRALDDATDDAKFAISSGMESQFARDPKTGVDKARTAAEARGEYLILRRKVSAARELVGQLDAAYTALQTKADILRSKGALFRSEIVTDGMSTPTPERAAARSKEDRERSVAEVMRSRRRRPADESEGDAD